MPIPSFLGPASRHSAERLRGFTGGAVPSRSHLGFSTVVQVQSNWCWAAVTHSIAHYYDPASSWTQCSVANATLGRLDCCNHASSNPVTCNKPYYLEKALAVTSNFARRVPSPLAFVDIKTEIDNDRPVGTRVGWNGGGGHFQIVTGCRIGLTGDEYLTISDPIYLDTEIRHSDFAAKYQAGGLWNFSYLTCDPSGGGSELSSGDMLVAQADFADIDLIGG